jgi:hypothetical protein
LKTVEGGAHLALHHLPPPYFMCFFRATSKENKKRKASAGKDSKKQ